MVIEAMSQNVFSQKAQIETVRVPWTEVLCLIVGQRVEEGEAQWIQRKLGFKELEVPVKSENSLS